MSSSSILDRFRELPRALRWALVGGSAIVALLVYDSLILTQAAEWRSRAEQIESRVSRATNDGDRNDKVMELRSVIEAFGDVSAPRRDADAASAALHKAVNEVLETGGEDGGPIETRDKSFEVNAPERMSTSAAGPLINASEQAKVVTGHLTVFLTPEEATRVVSLLEARPEVDRISKLQINAADDFRRKPQVRLELWLDAWVVEPAATQRTV